MISVDDAVTALRSVGYPLVRRDVPAWAGRAKLRIDVVAWGADAAGELVPQAAVEVKERGSTEAIPAALHQLATSRDLLGTRQHYLLLDGVWYMANAGLTAVVPVDGPEPAAGSGTVRLSEPALVSQMASGRLFHLVERRRGFEDASTAALSAAAQVIDEAVEHGGIIVDNQVISVPMEVLAESLFDSLLTWVMRFGRESGQYLTEPRVGAVFARLLAPTGTAVVLDPFCGSGSLLWHASQAAGPSAHLTLIGQDVDETIAAMARELGRLVPGGVEVRLSDSLKSELPTADYIITQPPIIPRLQRAHQQSDGQKTTDADVAVLDRCLRALRPGGRAVISTTRSWLWHESAGGYRRWLAEHAHVVALIGLPRGAFANTSIDSVVTVLAAAPPGETFVAQLGHDWLAELSDGGTALSAYREHLRSLQ